MRRIHTTKPGHGWVQKQRRVHTQRKVHTQRRVHTQRSLCAATLVSAHACIRARTLRAHGRTHAPPTRTLRPRSLGPRTLRPEEETSSLHAHCQEDESARTGRWTRRRQPQRRRPRRSKRRGGAQEGGGLEGGGRDDDHGGEQAHTDLRGRHRESATAQTREGQAGRGSRGQTKRRRHTGPGEKSPAEDRSADKIVRMQHEERSLGSEAGMHDLSQKHNTRRK